MKSSVTARKIRVPKHKPTVYPASFEPTAKRRAQLIWTLWVLPLVFPAWLILIWADMLAYVWGVDALCALSVMYTGVIVMIGLCSE
jgi:hypothetical protein